MESHPPVTAGGDQYLPLDLSTANGKMALDPFAIPSILNNPLHFPTFLLPSSSPVSSGDT